MHEDYIYTHLLQTVSYISEAYKRTDFQYVPIICILKINFMFWNNFNFTEKVTKVIQRVPIYSSLSFL